MLIINQPREGSVGERIIHHLGNHEFNKLSLVVAYARRSGVTHLLPYLRAFKSRGGAFNAIVGIDQQNTSVEALEILFGICDNLFVYHNERSYLTFHPKFYLFQSAAKSTMIVGSNNLTLPGLTTNYEMAIEYDFTSDDPTEKAEITKLENLLKSYSDETSPCCMQVKIGRIQELQEEDYIKCEEIIRGEFLRTPSGKGNRKRLFGSESFKAPTQTILTQEDQVTDEVTGVPVINAGFWKILSKNDVSKTSSPGQIVIPIRYKLFFPEFCGFVKTPSNAEQAEVYFDVIVVDKSGTKKRADNVRAIHYVPAPDHPRPNEELRFTFRNREIFDSLSQGEIVEFRRAASTDTWFEVTILDKTDPKHKLYADTGKKFGNI
jgi:HKD family nuclease